MNTTRYDISGEVWEPYPSKDGDWVRADEVEKEIDELNDRILDLEAMLRVIDQQTGAV